MTSVLITGGTGFIGRALITHRPPNICISVTTRHSEPFQRKHPSLASQVQFADRDALPMFDMVIHAEPSHPWWSITKARDRFLYLSSGAAIEADTHYGKGKRQGEFLCMTAAEAPQRLSISVARCWSFIGPNLPLTRQFAAGNFIFDGLNGPTIHVKGNGKATRSYLYESDMAAWLWSILFKGGNGCIYNVGSTQPVTIGELASAVADSFPKRKDVVFYNDTKQGESYYVPSDTDAAVMLGLHETVPLREAITRTIAHHR